ncbi:MAG: hypothetical protein U0703_03535 [Anaerolineae bacterium]
MSENQAATPVRTQVKIFFRNPEAVDTSAFAPLFQRWIQKQALEGLLIDVADYRHVFEGPGVILIGHESDYAIENRFGRLGLLYTRKHHTDTDLAAHLRQRRRCGWRSAASLADRRKRRLSRRSGSAPPRWKSVLPTA